MPLYLEDFTPGRTWAAGPRVVTGADIDAFVALTGDANPLHVDDAFARAHGYPARIAHGPLTASLAIGLLAGLDLANGTTLGLLSASWRHVAPVPAGTAIRLGVIVREVRPSASKPDRGVLTLALDVTNDAGTTVTTGDLVLMMLRRQA